jgi:hypothetical protein
LKKLWVLAAVLALSALAFAGSDMINFEQYSAYTVISNQYLATDGVSFSNSLQLVAPYYDYIDFPPESGSGVITNDPNDPIIATFTGVAGSPLAGNYVYSVSFYYASPTGVTLTAYNAAGGVIGTALGGAMVGADGQITFTSPGCTTWTAACAIAYITISSGNGPDSETVDNLSYQDAATPEPGTLVLLGSGILGLAGTLRRKLHLLNLRKAMPALLGLLAFVCTLSLTSSASQITGSVNDKERVRLAGNTRPEAIKDNDRGAVPDDFPMGHMLLQLKRSPEQEQAFEIYIEQEHNKHSHYFHQWLTAQEIGERYGMSEGDLGTITSWLQSHGLTVNVVYPSRMVIDFSGTAGQVREAFQTEIHKLRVKGQEHYANMSDPRIPAALTPAVVGVVSLHDFKPHSMLKKYTSGVSSWPYQLVPADYETIYNLNPLYKAGLTGTGQTIVLIEDTDLYNPPTAGQPCSGDWGVWRCTFGLGKYTGATLTTLHPAPPVGANNCSDPGDNSDDVEAAIDVEWANASAPNASVINASCNGSSTFGGLIAIQNLINESSTPPAIMSVSYGECEAENGAASNATFNSAYEQAAAEGVSVFVSSGDENAASCDADLANATHGIGVTGWGETPYNVAVGGTDYADGYLGTYSQYWNQYNNVFYESAKSYIPEIPWNGSCASVLFASYNGYSTTYGSSGFCNSAAGLANYIGVVGGSGGPSNCATGAAITRGVAGGTCAGYAKPAWQAGVFGNPSDGVRDIPDVSLFASNGYWGHYMIACYSNPANNGNDGTPCLGTAPSTWWGGGGTSFSSPMFAGIQALVNEYTNQRWGNPNTVYYQLANAEYGASGNPNCNSSTVNVTSTPCVFYDVTLGDIDVNCTGANCYLPSGTYGVLSAAPEVLTSIALSAKGSAYTSLPACAITGGNGSGGTCSATGIDPVNALTLSAPGTGYTATPTCALTGGGGSGATCTIAADPISTGSVTNEGTGYTARPTCTITGTGTGATCRATESGGKVTAISITAGGSGYSGTPTCAFGAPPAGGTQATCTVTASTATTGLTLVNAGANYTSAPSCAITGTGTGATCSATVSTGVAGVTLTAGGTYQYQPACALTGGGGTGATCTVTASGSATAYNPFAYPTASGWDFGTGIGSVNAYNLVMNWP